MKHVGLAAALVSLLLLAACQPDENLSPTNAPPPVDLSDPAIGQTSLYTRIHLAAGDTSATTFTDTLSLRVVEITTEGIIVEEGLTAYSTSLQGRPAVPFPDRVFRYRLSPKPAALAISPVGGARLESRLFPQLDEHAHELGYALKATGVTKLAGLRPQVPYLPRNREFRLELDGKQDLACVLAHAGREQGLPGFTFVHARNKGLQFVLIEHDLAGEASGWLRIED